MQLWQSHEFAPARCHQDRHNVHYMNIQDIMLLRHLHLGSVRVFHIAFAVLLSASELQDSFRCFAASTLCFANTYRMQMFTIQGS